MTDVPALARSTLDRAAHHRADQEWLDKAWSRARVIVVAPDGRALLANGALVLVDSADAPEGDRFFLGVDDDGVPHFAIGAEIPTSEDADEGAVETPAGTAMRGAELVHLWQVGHALSDADVGLFTSALALVQWHQSYVFSPRTGAPTQIADSGWVRRGPDGEQVFPRTDPAVIVLVHDGVAGPQGRVLLGRNAAWRPSGKPRYSVLAGFVELGESAEAAVVREVGEEVGVPVTEVSYVGSQSWPYPRSLMLGFTALGDPAVPLQVDPTEIADARWSTRAEITAVIDGSDTSFGLPNRSSIAWHLITRWLAW
jgi:NAD+ diphosphatase